MRWSALALATGHTGATEFSDRDGGLWPVFPGLSVRVDKHTTVELNKQHLGNHWMLTVI